ncbi:zinc finger CCCH domain-containing protein 46 [Physcomitrium patens]|uniref:C3H1-type domain-containing protein n=1 Tax=Physcomitrium patens TaxID=3218 RepID=A0A2K1KBF8_PHYPA|nr:zinc finger CCCH domain-containing protein 16-like [Physcomitrium patens]PNR51110.1 hypothetical protein PHYPA_010296 [Physcomitrium patens]|eukprot:XP_024380686.1 zinc finger CCCH domain-containing protein 16-like [Physcomitrella patens]
MSRQVCRDFQRGSCRFGTRCKFLHQTGSAPQQQNAFNSGPKQTQPGFGTNRFGAFNNAPNYFNNQRTTQPQSTAPKDHRCGNPKVCQDQIKEDISTEQPTFWRLTSYAHWKFLPNDICGDVSPEELRALAYDSGKQGLPFQEIVRREHSMNAAKIAEFETLQRNPYRGPATQMSGGTPLGQTQPSPFTSHTQTGFGFGTQNQSAAPAGSFGQPQLMFGVPVTTPQAGSGFSNAFNKTPTNPNSLQSSGFGQYSQLGQSGFGSAPKSVFGSQTITPFGTGINVFGGGFGTPAAAQPAGTTNSVNFGTSPFTTLGGFGTSPFAIPAANPQPSAPAVIPPATFNTLPLGTAPPSTKQTAIGVDGIWQKETWKLGEIPEEEPPESIRY